MRRVVVISIGAFTPLGKNFDEYWEGLKNGVSGYELNTQFDKEKFKTKFAYEVKGYFSGNYFDRNEANKLEFQIPHKMSADALLKWKVINRQLLEQLRKDERINLNSYLN